MLKTISEPLEAADDAVVKRAQYEAFEFEVSPGAVTVRNGSYATPEDHEYNVIVEDNTPVSCGCPADTHRPPCKHRVAVAIRKPVLTAASTPDGRPDDCACWSADQELPCFPCFNAGFEEPNDE